MIAGYLSTKMTGALTSGISAPIKATPRFYTECVDTGAG
ncbi:hypothetical protein EHW99_3514 [Erwinia amylovora]|uniref:Uncharacterized protein n=2 Tax=Erwinia amylovora TaxID=552 RepID=A0A830ZWM7_ERWAM|nr:hypothetical protein EaACW_3590 [Erwinia amylovora ACW56400]QJQ56213.1 hypothetical protein EHX00_3514 [Erwinia amylovora]CBA23904.1 hypothetical protein predicted by Glimmer/Critica [Erwinia amylovora CFBP1430]CCO80426.1 hypothetical protein BN432_3658 [Erwinia amylovora Ea356]CCO84233.1 hypothetical protein BN433_3688 [Erwinia amylovora Ea266]CCO87991.1 hypothetical protein BN434_3633 [Erwinia amylovora CFBP 2585]CCO91783.1 hypothetical protein BN435_3642 [Erwinia amylovora 01SFR-BO]CCO